MRNWLCAAALATCVFATHARAEPPDPFDAPFFRPTHGPALGEAVAANDPRAVALPTAADECPCPLSSRAWLTAEVLIGRTRGPSVVPVVTTGPASAGALAGAVGQPDTLPLFGGRRLLDDWRSGVRAELGVWFDDRRTSGVSARFYSLFSTNEELRATPAGATVVNVPQVVNVGAVGLQVPVFVSFPGVTAGRVSASAQTTFAGGDLNWRHAIEQAPRLRVELLAGYRQLYLADELNVNFAVTPAGANATLFTGSDDARTRNSFYGPQLGLCLTAGGERVWIDGHAATALGATVSELDFVRTRTLGLLGSATASDRLTYFGVVCESGVRLNCRASEHVRLTAGYSFLYWNNVRRGPEMFALGPALRGHAIDFATHLFSVGLDVRF